MVIPASPPRTSSSASSGLSILVAEDDPHVQSLLRLCLEGHSVTVTGSGSAACVALAEKSFDVVITDLRLPDLGGDEVARRAAVARPGAFIVLMTGALTGGPQTQEELTAAGVHARLAKPFLPRELKALMESAQRARETGADR